MASFLVFNVFKDLDSFVFIVFKVVHLHDLEACSSKMLDNRSASNDQYSSSISSLSMIVLAQLHTCADSKSLASVFLVSANIPKVYESLWSVNAFESISLYLPNSSTKNCVIKWGGSHMYRLVRVFIHDWAYKASICRINEFHNFLLIHNIRILSLEHLSGNWLLITLWIRLSWKNWWAQSSIASCFLDSESG